MKRIDDEDAVRACRADAARAMGAGVLDRACMRVDRRSGGAGMRRGGRAGGTDYPDPGLIAVTNFSAANYLATQSGGGEPGVATGYGFVALVQLLKIPTANDYILSSLGGTFPALIAMAAGFRFWTLNGAAGNVAGAARPVVASDIGKIFLVVGRRTASDTCELYVDRTLAGSTASVGYTVGTGGMGMGAPGGATSIACLGALTFRGVPSDAQILAFFDAVRARGDMPESFPGATVTHRWSAKEELLRVSNPAGRKALGARLFSDTVYLQAAGTTLPGVNTGFWCAHYCTQDRLTGGSSNGILIGRRTESPSAGWEIYSASSGASLILYISQGSGSPVQVIYTMTAADIGRPLLVLVMFDAALQKARLIVNRTEVAQVTCTGYLAASGVPFRLGRHAVDAVTANGADKTGWLGSSGGHASLTAGEIAQLFDDVERAGRIQAVTGKTDSLWDPTLDILANGGAMPTTFADRIGTATLTRTGTLEVAQYTDTAPPAPAQLTDQTTRASADALLRVGTPSVKVIDPTVDGRRTLGALGFSDANGLTCSVAAPGVVGTSAGFTLTVRIRWDAVPTGNQMIAVAAQVGGGTFWFLRTVGASLTLTASAGSSAYTVTAADLGQWVTVQAQFTGTAVRLFVRGVQVGTDVASGIPVSPSSYMRLGYWPSQAFVSGAISGASGGNYVATLAELQQQVADTDATGRLVAIPGMNGATPKTEHLWDLTTDILASGVDAVPATVLDRVGTDHLTRVGIDVRSTANSIRAIGPYGLADGWVTAPGGGIRGGTSYHVVADLWFTAVPTTTTYLVHCTAAGGAGWSLFVSSGGVLQMANHGFGNSSGYTLTGADLNKRLRVVVTYSAGTIRLYVQGVQSGVDTAPGFSASAATVSMFIGQLNGANAFVSGYVEAVGGGNTAASLGNVATYNADLTQAFPSIAGVTLKRYVFEQDIAAVSGALPAKSVERVSGADDMVRFGSGLTLAQRTERVWSYETSPFTNGFLMPTYFDAFEASNVQIGNTTGAWWWTAVVQQIATSAGGKRFLYKSTGSAGFVAFTLNGSSYQLQAANGAAMATAPVAVIAATDIGKVGVVTLMWDPTTGKLRTFYKRLEVGAGTTLASGYTPDTGALAWGAIRSGGGSGQNEANQLGLCGGNYLLSVAEVQAQHDAILASDGVIQAVPGKTGHLWNGKRLAATSVFTPGVTTIPDEIGTANMVLANTIGGGAIGTPSRADIYARAFAA